MAKYHICTRNALIIIALLLYPIFLMAQADTDGAIRMIVRFDYVYYNVSNWDAGTNNENTIKMWAADYPNYDGYGWRGGSVHTASCWTTCYSDVVPDYWAYDIYDWSEDPNYVALQYQTRVEYWEDDCFSCSGGSICLSGCSGGDRYAYQCGCPCGCDCSCDDNYLYEDQIPLDIRTMAPGWGNRGWWNYGNVWDDISIYWTPPRPDYARANGQSSYTICKGGAFTLTSTGAEFGGDYRWYRSGTYLGDFGTSWVTTAPTTTGAYNYDVYTNHGSLNSLSYRRVVVTVIDPAAWLWSGTVSTDWFDYRNWNTCNAIPTSASNVEIPGNTTYQPTIGSGTAYCNTIEIVSSATPTKAVLTISSGATLQVTQ